MNPLTNVKNITKLNETELAKGTKKSWHDMYKDSAWVFIGGLAYGLTEGDILAVFSQYGEIVNINLVRDKKTGKTKGFCFLCYANQKSTVLAVDNFNGIKLCNRTIRVDHVANYKPPKEDERDDELTKLLKSEGCAPKLHQPNDDISITESKKEKKKRKKEKKEKKKKKKKHSKGNESESEVSVQKKVKIKEEKVDPGYDKYEVLNESKNLQRQLTERSHRSYLGEGSSLHKEYMSEVDNKHHKYKDKNSLRNDSTHGSNAHEKPVRHKTHLRGDVYRRSNSPNERVNASRSENVRHRSSSTEAGCRTEYSQHIDYRKNSSHRSMDREKRKRSRSRSSSSDSSSSSSSEDSWECKEKTDKFKNRHSQDISSKEFSSSSDDDRHKMSNHERYDKKSYSQVNNKNKYDDREGNFDNNRSSKNKCEDRSYTYSEHKPRDKYQDKKRTDKYSTDSHHNKSKYDRR